MQYVKTTYDTSNTDPETGNLLRFVEVSGAASISVYRGNLATPVEVRLGSTVVNTYAAKEDAIAAATEMAETIGDIVYEITTT